MIEDLKITTITPNSPVNNRSCIKEANTLLFQLQLQLWNNVFNYNYNYNYKPERKECWGRLGGIITVKKV